MAGVEDGRVEGHVGVDVVVSVFGRGILHPVAPGEDLGHFVCSGALGGEGRPRRLDDLPHLAEVLQEPLVRANLVPPGQDVRIEQVPVAAQAHLRADLRSGLDQPLRGQDLDRLPHDRPAHAESLTQCRFIGQRGARCRPVAEHKEPELVDDLPVQSTPEVRCPVSCHYRSTKIQMNDSYYCMMIDSDHSEVAPHCQASSNTPRQPLRAKGKRRGSSTGR